MEQQSTWSKWFRAEVAVAFTIGSIVVGSFIYLTSPVNNLNTQMAVVQNQIAELKANDLVHIELSQQSTDTRLEDVQKQLTNIQTQLAAINALMSQKNH